MKLFQKYSLLILLIFTVTGCATLKLQVDDTKAFQYPGQKELIHSFYLLGDAGNSEPGETELAINDFEMALSKASKNSTAIFLGDNIYPKGFDGKKISKQRLRFQTDALQNFEGETIFIPGNHDWYSGIDGLKDQEKFVEKALGKNTFLPENGCPIEKVKISDEVVLIVIDSQWYLTNWDNHPKINDNCDIKTRTDFLNEFTINIEN